MFRPIAWPPSRLSFRQTPSAGPSSRQGRDDRLELRSDDPADRLGLLELGWLQWRVTWSGDDEHRHHVGSRNVEHERVPGQFLERSERPQMTKRRSSLREMASQRIGFSSTLCLTRPPLWPQHLVYHRLYVWVGARGVAGIGRHAFQRTHVLLCGSILDPDPNAPRVHERVQRTTDLGVGQEALVRLRLILGGQLLPL